MSIRNWKSGLSILITHNWNATAYLITSGPNSKVGFWISSFDYLENRNWKSFIMSARANTIRTDESAKGTRDEKRRWNRRLKFFGKKVLKKTVKNIN